MTGNEFREWRVKHGLTQPQAGLLLGRTKVTIIQWEHGRRPIPKVVELAVRHLTDRRDAFVWKEGDVTILSKEAVAKQDRREP
ncbi:MAG: hypothetical protein WD379_08950 [Dehalococcoidia bacterium]